VAARPDLLRLETRVLPAVFIVNSFLDGRDANPGDGVALTADGRTTLRAAVMEANALPGPDTIVLPAGTYTLDAALNDPASPGSSLVLRDAITILGAGGGATRIQGDGRDRLFDVPAGVSATLADLTLAGGIADAGGAVRVAGVLTLQRSTLADNDALAGGALSVSAGGSATVIDSLFRGNSAERYGGAVVAAGAALSVAGSAFVNNSSANGGAVALFGGTASFTASTFGGNQAGGAGGAIDADAAADYGLFSTTVTANRAALGGGLYTQAMPQVRDTILAGNTAANGPDFFGRVVSLGHNLVGDIGASRGFGASGDLFGTAGQPLDPRLSPLGDHGGPTPTYVPLPGSPALGAGSDGAAAPDQRGIARPQLGRPDIGAVEARTFSVVNLSAGQHAAVGTAFDPPLRVQFLEGGAGLAGVPVTFTAPAGPGPGGAFLGETTVLTDADGVATAPPMRAGTVAGDFRVRATVAGALGLDLPLTTDPGPAVAFTLAGAPPSARAGEAFPLTVTAWDAFGNRATGYAGTVTFASDDPQAGLPGAYTFTPADQGAKTFAVTLRTAGRRGVRVTDAAAGFGAAAAAAVTPAAASRFDLTAPASADEGAPFAVTLTARDPFGNRATDFTGTVYFTSDDPRAQLPAGVRFAPGDAGEVAVPDFVLRTPGPHALAAGTATGAARGSTVVAVNDLGPGGLTLTAESSPVAEGEPFTLTGRFTNPDARDTHTVVIRWGDGTPAVALSLGRGVFTFRATHTYADQPPNGGAAYPVTVTVTDAGGGWTSAALPAAVVNLPPVVGPVVGGQFFDAGQAFSATGTFADAGRNNTWSATVDYGDGTGPQPLPLQANMSFRLNHVYTAEGTFTVVVQVRDGDGGVGTQSERVAVFLPGTADLQAAAVAPGGRGTVRSGGVTATLANGPAAALATLLAGTVPLDVIRGLAGSPAADPRLQVLAFDLRLLNAGPGGALTVAVQFDPIRTATQAPQLYYYDPRAGAFLPARGSALLAGPFAVDAAAGTVTIQLDATSVPTLGMLNGTLFALAVPVPGPAPAPKAATPFLVFAAPAAPPGLASDVATAPRAAAATTALVSSSGLTVSLAAADGLRRDGAGRGLSNLLTPQTVAVVLRTVLEIRDFLSETYRMWTDQPAPIAAPIDPARAVEALQRPADLTPPEEITLPVQAAPPEKSAPPAVFAPTPAAAVEPVIAPAESHPWWLAAYQNAPEAAAAAQPPAEPSTSEKAAALLTGLWLGGLALKVSAPEKPANPEPPAPPPDTPEDEPGEGEK
jgi:hypothetical protein